MPRFKKNITRHKGKKHYGKHNRARKPPKVETDRKKRNLKFIQRSKEAEETQRRQKVIEEKYKSESFKQIGGNSDDSLSDAEEQINPFEQLVSGFQHEGNENKLKIIESSDDESNLDDDDDDDNDEEMEEAETNSIDESIEEEDFDSESHKSSDIDDLEEVESEAEYVDEMSENEMSSETQSKIAEESSESEDENDPEGHQIIEEELDEATEITETNHNLQTSDPFSIHFDLDISSELLESLSEKPPVVRNEHLVWPILGNVQLDIPYSKKTAKGDTSKKSDKKILNDTQAYASEGSKPDLISYKAIDLNKLHIKKQLQENLLLDNQKYNTSKHAMTPLQAELFSVMNNYQDLFYSSRTLNNGEEIRLLYSLHSVNHVLKSRTKILHHNAKLSASANSKTPNVIVPDSYRDQGLVRPKVLILLPFRDSAYRVVNNFVRLLYGEKEGEAKSKGSVINYKRFEEEFTGDTIKFPSKNPKPEDYEKTFAGNTDDNFRIGISFTKKCIKLYTDFYSSDILIASPVGLRMIIGAPGESERDYDFLASIELLILDQVDIFFVQNWDHVLHVFDHLHLQPQSVRSTDFSRVRSWCLNGWSRFYRQTLLFATHELPEFRSLFNSHCCSYRGKARTVNPVVGGSIKHVITQVPQVFHRIDVHSIESSFDTRFKYFIKEVLPQFTGPSMAHCMIYVPSYFDFVRLRNHFKAENMNFVQISEYTKDGKIARARDMFFHSAAHFLLYSERAHFFRRTRIKGIRHLIMYQPPFWPHLYSEMVNLMQDSNQNARDGLESSMSVTILYSKYDMLQAAAIVGTYQATKMFRSPKTTCMFMTGD